MNNPMISPFPVRAWRMLRLLMWTAKLIWVCRVHYPFLPQAARDIRTCKMARQALRILRIRTEVTGQPPEHVGHTLFVANHVSWLDVVALLEQYPMNFVAKKEIRSWFLLGKVVENVGSIFVDRSRSKDTNYINQLMAKKLGDGFNVAFFPESRTSEDGLHVRPFKAALFESAALSRSDIRPLVIRFYDSQARRTTLPAYTDDVNLFGCVRNILSLRETVVRLDFLSCIPAAEVLASDRFALKNRIEADITTVAESDIAASAD